MTTHPVHRPVGWPLREAGLPATVLHMSKNMRRRTRNSTRAGRRPLPRLPPPLPAAPRSAVPNGEGTTIGAAAEQATLLAGLITSGALDGHLALLTRVIGQRQRHLLDAASVRALAIIHVGDRVRINRHIRPFYLRGSTGTVTGWSGRSAIVSLDVPTGRFAEVRCPAIGLDRLASESGD